MVLVTIRYTRNGGTKDSDIYWGDLTAYFGEEFERLVQWAKQYGNTDSFIPLRGAAYLALLELVGDNANLLDKNGFPIFLFLPTDDCYRGDSWEAFCAKIAMQPAYAQYGWTMELMVETDKEHA